MTTPTPGAIRPNSALPFSEARLLDSRLNYLAAELLDLQRFTADLTEHQAADQRLRGVARLVARATSLLDQAKPLARQLWNEAHSAEGQA
ncbi:hypothetical protein EWI61_00095 [Methylolobus aquaticus]|nr:hypothetical protein EWI61_00095 [Methylolobus aquaticus]